MEQAAPHCHGPCAKAEWLQRKANDKLMDFCGSARKHSEGRLRTVYVVTFSTTSRLIVELLFFFFLFFFLYATISEPIQITPRPHERELYVFCYLTCFQPDGVGGLEKAISLRLFPSIVFTSQGTIALYYVTWPKLGRTHTQSIYTHMRPRRHESSLDVPLRRIIAII